MTGRLLVANLDAEIAMARATSPGPHPEVSPRALARAARAGSWMASLGRPGDALWLPAAVPAEELAPPARRLEVVTGPLLAAAAGRAVLAWAVTGEIEALRETAAAAASAAASSGWRDRLWSEQTTADVTRRVNHRAFAFALAGELGWALPGAALIRDLAELEHRLASGAAAAGGGRWIVKAPHAAAGRERLRQSGTALAPGARARIERLLGRYGELLLEPWVERILDLGCVGLVAAGRVDTFPPHRLDSDEAGVFRAAAIDDRPGAIGPAEELREIREAAARCGEALAVAGYRGPFGIDAYAWRDPAGAIRLQRVSEINARLTFGHLARAAAEDAGVPAGPFELRP